MYDISLLIIYCFHCFTVFLDSGSDLKAFLDETANMSADDRAKHLEKNQVNFFLFI